MVDAQKALKICTRLPIRYVVYRKRSEGHLLTQSFNENNHKNKNRAKTTKERKKKMPERIGTVV